MAADVPAAHAPLAAVQVERAGCLARCPPGVHPHSCCLVYGGLLSLARSIGLDCWNNAAHNPDGSGSVNKGTHLICYDAPLWVGLLPAHLMTWDLSSGACHTMIALASVLDGPAGSAHMGRSSMCNKQRMTHLAAWTSGVLKVSQDVARQVAL